jgi:hypothetical protein
MITLMFEFRGLVCEARFHPAFPEVDVIPLGPHTTTEIKAIFDRMPAYLRRMASAN